MSASSKPGGLAVGADVDGHVVVTIGVRLSGRRRLALVGLRRCRPLEIEHDRVGHRDTAPLDRFVAGGTFLQSRQRLVDRRVIDRDLLAAEREARIVARIDRRHRFEARRELQRLAFLDDDVANVGCVDGLDAAFAQRLVHRTRDETVCDVVRESDRGTVGAPPSAAPCPDGTPGSSRPDCSRVRPCRSRRRLRCSGFRPRGSCACH